MVPPGTAAASSSAQPAIRASSVPANPAPSKAKSNDSSGAYLIDTVAGGLIRAAGPGLSFGQQPFDVATSGKYVYAVDNYDAVVWQLDQTTGVERVIAGDGTQGYSGDGGPATGAEMLYPVGIAADSSGDIFVSDSSNQRVRMIAGTTCATNCPFGLLTTVVGDIYTIAGDGVPGFSGDATPALWQHFIFQPDWRWTLQVTC
jgi:hypothetical protein